MTIRRPTVFVTDAGLAQSQAADRIHFGMPRQRNTREENTLIKEGKIPED